MKAVWLLVVLGLATACGSSNATNAPPVRHPARVQPSPPGALHSGPSRRPPHERFLPAPEQAIPTGAHTLATTLVRTTRALRSSIARWTGAGHPSRGAPPMDVQLRALYQQRIYGFLAGRRALARRAVALLPAGIGREAAANLAAIHDLLSLVHPVKHPPPFRVIPARPAGVLLRYYRRAQRRFGVSWSVLAAVNYIESKFGRVASNSYAGAQGPMQFEPATWRAYGMGGDVHEPHDAIMGAANYLRASGAPTRYREALYAYDPAGAYVDAVLEYAHRMRADPRAFYEYYNWQVFVTTRHGVKRVTGPGLGR